MHWYDYDLMNGVSGLTRLCNEHTVMAYSKYIITDEMREEFA